MWKWIVGIPVAGFLFMMLLGSCSANTPDGQERSRARAAIELCWKDQAKKSMEPDAARFVAGACEKMEADFRERHGRNP